MDAQGRSDIGSTAAGFVAGLGCAALLAAGAVVALDLDVSRAGSPAPDPTATGTASGPAPDDAPDAEAAEPEPMDFDEVYSAVSGGVARIERLDCGGGGMGSGALVAPDLVITAAHVVHGYTSLKIMLGDQVAGGEVVGYASDHDVALVRTSAPLSGHVFDVVDEPSPVGTEIIALGYPRSGPLSLAGPGVVSTYGEDVRYELQDGTMMEVDELLRMTVPTNAGNSGGPVVDRAGEIVGLVSGGAQSLGAIEGDEVVVDVVQGFEYAVPAKTVSDRLEEWVAAPAPYAAGTCEETPVEESVDLVTAMTEGPDTDSVRSVLFDYFDGINRSDYERAYRQLSAERRAVLSLERFTEQQSTSWISDVVVLGVAREGDTMTAEATFTTWQAPEFGPDGLDCAFWVREYQLTAGGDHGWSIAGTVDVDGAPPFQACG